MERPTGSRSPARCTIGSRSGVLGWPSATFTELTLVDEHPDFLTLPAWQPML